MRSLAFVVVAAGASIGCGGDDDPSALTFEHIGLDQEFLNQLVLDSNERPIVSGRYQLWRYSFSRTEWGQVGINGRAPQFIPRRFVIDHLDRVFAPTGGDEEAPMYMLPAGGGAWQAIDSAPTYSQLAVDRNGTVYACATTCFRLAPGGTTFELFDDQAALGRFCSSQVSADNTVYMNCEDPYGVWKLASGASRFEHVTELKYVHSFNRDGSLNVTMMSGANGRLAPGETTPTPYPVFPSTLIDEYKPDFESFYAATPIPFAVDDSGTRYSVGKEYLGTNYQVFILGEGDSEWTPLGDTLRYEQRFYTVTGGGDVYTYDASADPEGVYLLRRSR